MVYGCSKSRAVGYVVSTSSKGSNGKKDLFLLDVRKSNDYEKLRIAGSHHIWVGDLPHKINEVPRDKKVVVYCDSGYKSTIACSILKINGYDDVSSVLGSMGAWLNAGYPVIK